MATSRVDSAAPSPGGNASVCAGASSVQVIAVSAAGMAVGAALGFTPGFIATELRADLGISRGEVGLLVSVYFGCTGLGSVLGGRLTERLGARLVVALDMAMVAAAGAFSALVGTYWSLLVAAVLAGAGYALVNAGTNVAIGRAVAPERRTLAMSIKTAGVPFMALVTAAVGPWAADRWSWHAISFVVAAVALAVTLAALVVLDDDRPERTAKADGAALPPGFIWFPLGAFLLIAGSQPLYSWVVAYLEESLDASPAVAGGVSALASGVGLCVMMLNALRTDLAGPQQRVRRIMLLLGVSTVGTLLVLVGEAVGIGLVVVGAVIGISAQLSAIGTMHATVVDRAPGAVAAATGLTMTGYYLGALFSPAAFGALADVTDTFAYSWGATAALLVLAIPAWGLAGRVPVARAEEPTTVLKGD